MRRLPPMGALEAFVAVAGNGTLTASSGELNLSVSAISRRIQSLEAYVGTALFDRLPHELRLTGPGERLLENAGPIFDALAQVLADVHRTEAQRLTIGVPPSFASAWLLPRIADFRARHGGIEIGFDSAGSPLARLGGSLDAAIVFGESVGGDIHAEVLKRQNAFAVAAPGIVRPDLRPDEALAEHTFLLHSGLPRMIESWLAAHDLEGRSPARVEYFDSGPMLVAAAEAGLGVALTLEDMVRFYPGSGGLERPFDDAVPTSYSYYFVCRRGALANRALVRFHDWLFAQMDAAAPAGQAELALA